MPNHSGMPEEDGACGYCTLMCHSPALATGITFVVLPLPPAPLSVAFHGAHAPAPTHRDQRARGPPGLIC